MIIFSLKVWCILLGALMALAAAAAIFLPAQAADFLKRFPRNRIAGCVLAILSLAWGGWVLHVMPLEFLLAIDKFVIPGTIIAMFLACFCIPELLSIRGLGGFFILIPAPVLQVARIEPGAWRLVIVVWMYLLAIQGMMMILWPWIFRDELEVIARHTRKSGIILAVFALFILALGLLCA